MKSDDISPVAVSAPDVVVIVAVVEVSVVGASVRAIILLFNEANSGNGIIIIITIINVHQSPKAQPPPPQPLTEEDLMPRGRRRSVLQQDPPAVAITRQAPPVPSLTTVSPIRPLRGAPREPDFTTPVRRRSSAPPPPTLDQSGVQSLADSLPPQQVDPDDHLMDLPQDKAYEFKPLVHPQTQMASPSRPLNQQAFQVRTTCYTTKQCTTREISA